MKKLWRHHVHRDTGERSWNENLMLFTVIRPNADRTAAAYGQAGLPVDLMGDRRLVAAMWRDARKAVYVFLADPVTSDQ